MTGEQYYDTNSRKADWHCWIILLLQYNFYKKGIFREVSNSVEGRLLADS